MALNPEKDEFQLTEKLYALSSKASVIFEAAIVVLAQLQLFGAQNHLINATATLFA